MSDNEKFEQVEIVVAQGETADAADNAMAALRRDLREIGRRLDSARLLLGAILAMAAVCLALLIILVSRGT